MIGHIFKLFETKEIGLDDIAHAAPVVLVELRQIRDSLGEIIDVLEDLFESFEDDDPC